MNLGDPFCEALLGGTGASSPGKILKSWYCLVASDASFCCFFFCEQIELSNQEFFRA